MFSFVNGGKLPFFNNCVFGQNAFDHVRWIRVEANDGIIERNLTTITIKPLYIWKCKGGVSSCKAQYAEFWRADSTLVT